MSENGEYRRRTLANLAPCCSIQEACFRAVRARDRRFDGRFFTAVASTGIYCRPICPVRPPKRENMRFFSSAAAAEGAGFRPCLRCRPERAPGLASVDAASRLVGAAIAGIEEHAVSNARVGDLAASLGVSDRHLRRVTEAELGVSPIELAQTQKLLLAKRLLERDLAQADRDRIRFRVRQRAPIQRAVQIALWLESAQSAPPRRCGLGPCVCQLDFRPPLAWESLLAYLRLRAIPGVEWVDGTHYRRTVAIGEHRGWIAVSLAASRQRSKSRSRRRLAPVIGAVIVRVKHLFDLGATPDAVARAAVAGCTARRHRAPAAGSARRRRVRRLRARGACRARSAGVRESGDHARRPLGRAPSARPSRRRSRSSTPSRRVPRACCEVDRRGDRGTRHGRRARPHASWRSRTPSAERRVVLGLCGGRRGADREPDAAPGHRPVDRAVHRHARVALARCISGGDLMLLRAARLGKKAIAPRAPRPGGRGAPTRLIIYGNHWESYHEQLYLRRKSRSAGCC